MSKRAPERSAIFAKNWKIVESMETCQRGPRQGPQFLRKLRELQFLRKMVESTETCQRGPRQGLWFLRKTVRSTIFYEKLEKLQANVKMSKRATTRSAIFTKTARIAIIVKSAKKLEKTSTRCKHVKEGPDKVCDFCETCENCNNCKICKKLENWSRQCKLSRRAPTSSAMFGHLSGY